MKEAEQHAQQLQARAFSYFTFSRLLLYPGDEFHQKPFEQLKKTFELLLCPFSSNGYEPEGNINNIREAYNRLFEHRDRSPLCEFSYRSKDFLDVTRLLSDLAAFYRAFGVRAEGNERHDHIATELEYMALAALKESQAVLENRRGEAETCRDIQQKFFNEHLGCFYSNVVETLKNSGHPFYEAAGIYLHDFLSNESSFLGGIT